MFVEKPHAIDPVGVRQVTAACELAKQKKLSVMSGLHSRFHPGYQETIKRIHDGAIGEIVAIEENFFRGPYGLYYRQPNQNEVEYQFGNQYHFAWLSGDDVTQSLVHNLDRATWAMQGADADQGPRTRRAIGFVRRDLRQRVRPSFRGLRICQRRADVRPLPHAERLLQRTASSLFWAARADAYI